MFAALILKKYCLSNSSRRLPYRHNRLTGYAKLIKTKILFLKHQLIPIHFDRLYLGDGGHTTVACTQRRAQIGLTIHTMAVRLHMFTSYKLGISAKMDVSARYYRKQKDVNT